MKFIYVVMLSLITLPAAADEADDLRAKEEGRRRVSMTLKNLADERVVPAKKINLKDGKVAWVHGNHSDAIVTIDGQKAAAGSYESLDGKIKLTVGEDGKIATPSLTEEVAKIKAQEAAVSITEQEQKAEEQTAAIEQQDQVDPRLQVEGAL